MSIELFKFENNEVRVILIDNEPWFVGADICKVLEVNNTSDVYQRLRPYEKKTIDSIDGLDTANPNVVVISESGVYRIVMTSRKPNAERFQDWVCEEVLPSIRKNGFYGVNSLTPLEQLKIVVDAGVEHERRLKEQELITKKLREEVDEIKTIAIEAAKELKEIPKSEEAPATISERGLINQLVRAYSQSKSVGYSEIWGQLYKELYYRCHVDVKSRAKKSKKSLLDEVEKAGLMHDLYNIASDKLTEN